MEGGERHTSASEFLPGYDAPGEDFAEAAAASRAGQPAILKLVALAHVSCEDIQAMRDFWSPHLEGGDSGAFCRDFDRVLAGTLRFRPEHLVRILNLFHASLVKEGVDPEAFLMEEVYGQFGPFILDPGGILDILQPHLEACLLHPRHLPNAFLILEDLIAGMFPFLKPRVRIDWKPLQPMHLRIDLDRLDGGPHFDCGAWIAPLVRRIPALFGLTEAGGRGRGVRYRLEKGRDGIAGARTQGLAFVLEFAGGDAGLAPLKPLLDSIRVPGEWKADANLEAWKRMSSSFSACELVYLKNQEIMLLDGRRIASKVPAKILRHMLGAFLERGKSRFHVNEFSTHPDIVKDFRKDPSLNVRLMRLERNLSEKGIPIGIARNIGTGMIELRLACDIRYRETED